MKNILVPTDFSKNAKNALNYAVALAKKEKAKIILLHVQSIPYSSPDVPIGYFTEELLALEDESKKRLNALCAQILKSDKVKCDAINQQGLVTDVITDVIKSKKADLLIMGTKGASGIKEMLIGSTTAKVIGKAQCPVIAIPEKATFNGIKKMVYATDYHASDIPALKQLAAIAKIFNAKINVIHFSDEDYLQEQVEKKLKKFETTVKRKIDQKNITYQVVYADEIEKKLESYIKKESIDLVAMSTKHRNVIERLFGNSITKKLAYHTKVPLMAFHYKQEPVVFI